VRILVSGSTGLIGSALVKSLAGRGHEITRLVRPGRAVVPGSVMWDPTSGLLELKPLEGFDAVIHLAGENVAAQRWTPEQKRRIRDSRVRGTSLLCSRLKELANPPAVAVLASAVGYYGDRGDEELTEDATPGDGFLADVTREWEEASAPLAHTSIREVRLRTGTVLSTGGGVLPRLLPLFKSGLGGTLGTGRQYMSWIAIDDLIGIIDFAMSGHSMSGAVNAVAPHPVTNREFTRALAKALGRPALLAAPRFALRLISGEMADDLLLASTRAVPVKLIEAGYRFMHPELKSALDALFGK